MKRINFILLSIVAVIALFFVFGFTSEQLSQQKLDVVLKEIPDEWWNGGWDKRAQLQDLITQNPNDLLLCAKAQYYIACQYYANQDYQTALQEYQKLINTYPSSWLESQRAQFEIAQIYLYCLNNPNQAILEYEKAINNYPKSFMTAKAQIALARAYRKLQDFDNALKEYQKVLDKYPEYKYDVTEANLDLGYMLIAQATMPGTSQQIKESKLKESLSAYKRAYFACNLEDAEFMKQSLDGIYRVFKCLDSNLARANSFIKFQKYGPAGEDKALGTEDDLTDPIKDF